jgi:hypothetical protein
MKIPILLAATAIMVAGGCNGPTRSADLIARKQASLPSSWVHVATSSGHVRALPEGLQTRLKDLRADLVQEQESRYFAFYGEYTPETQARIDAMNRACTEAYMVSDRVIAGDLSPAMRSLTETEADIWWNDQIVYDTQWREFQDDWRVLWLTDSPSILNRQPIIDSVGP